MNEQIRRATLTVVTMPQDKPEPPCDGSYTCGCTRCLPEVATLVARGVRPLKSTVGHKKLHRAA